MFKARPPQQEILDYTGGRYGVSAVPGSGKTHTLSALAARLIIENRLADDQEVLIVTLVNSAVENFSSRVEKFLAPYQLVPGFGYRVRTLHGLAHDIVRERPDLVGLSTQFQIIDERDSDSILRDAAVAWLRANPTFYQNFIDPDIDHNRLQSVVSQQWPELMVSLARSFISQAKDLQAPPALIRQALSHLAAPPLLLQMGLEIFEDYQRALNYRSGVDFNDLIRLALQALETDPDYLARLSRRWPYVLEDEAQDSSRLQERILSLLTRGTGNWVRVGDPNQAIYETFTTANPRFLIDFRDRPDVTKKDLPHSGRSTLSIIRLANYLSEWVQTEHPVESLRDALNEPYIQSTPPGDPQPNPPDNSRSIYLSRLKWTPEEEVKNIVSSIRRWLPEHPNHTLAVLVPRNERGAEVVAECRKYGIEPIELLRSSISTRQTASILSSALVHLADPTSSHKLSALFLQIFSREGENPQSQEQTLVLARSIRQMRFTEDFIWPRPDRNWLAGFNPEPIDEESLARLETFRGLIRDWQSAVLLPIDQLLLTLSQTLFSHPADLALAHKLALAMEQDAQRHPDWNLHEFVIELDRIARNERKFMGFTEEDTGFDPDKHPGKVVVATIHKAKGLEWDRVFLLSANNYDFPSLENYESWISEKWFIRNHLNLEAEAIAQLKALMSGDPSALHFEEGEASLQARLDYAAERLRLLYVGITRARQELVITWNTGRKGSCLPSTPLLILTDFLEANTDALTD